MKEYGKDLLTLIQTRRSIRKFKPDMVPKDIIDKITAAGTYAPTGMNRQSPIIIAVTNKEVRDRLSKLNAEIMGTDSDPFYGARSASAAAGYIVQKKNLNALRAEKF